MKLVIDIKGKLEENDILVYRVGQFHPVRIKTLLPELNDLQEQINVLQKEIKILNNIIENQRKMIEQNAKDIRIDRGLEDEQD